MITAKPVGPSTFAPFGTFCSQVEENIWVNGGPGYAYVVSSLSNHNDNSKPNYLSTQTAWLYRSYMDGTLAGYVNDVAHNDALQYGIWSSLGYSDAALTDHYGNRVSTMKNNYQGYGWSMTPANWTESGPYQVAIANLTRDGNPSEHAQDMLVMTKTTAVPEPSMAVQMLVPLGMMLVRRRRLAVAE